MYLRTIEPLTYYPVTSQELIIILFFQQTSGGTVLSTNWGEVSEKDYEKERVAPDGYKWEKVDY